MTGEFPNGPTSKAGPLHTHPESTAPSHLVEFYEALRHFEPSSLGEGSCQICDAHDRVAPLADRGSAHGSHAACMAVLRLHSREVRAEIAERRRIEARLSGLLRLSEVLASSIDYETTVANVLGLAIPALGDLGFLDLLEGGREMRRVARAHQDPGMEALLASTDRFRSTPGHFSHCALSGKPVLHAAIDDAWMERAATGPEDLAVMRGLGFVSMIAVPLESQGRIRGGLTVFCGRSGRRHDRSDLDLARELAYRATAALENARLYRERTEALQRQAEADRRKDEFLAMLGHELRNPLAPILTALQVMDLRGDPRSQRERDIIRRQAEHLTRLVDDLLDISRIVRGHIALRRETVEISSVLAQAIEVASPLLEHFAHKLSLAAPPAGATVRGDPFRMAQVFANLLTNAAKYTSRGGRIAVDARREDDSVVVEVSDNGSGIAREMLPVIFEPFVQGGRTLDRSQGGLGLGLALIKILTELHGGTVAAQSEGPGRGSIFTVRLPAAPAAAAGEDDHPPAAGRRDAARALRRRVLVVDDNRDAADMLAVALQEAGYEVEVAYDGPGALARAAAAPPQCAVVDIGLPVMDGWELAGRLRASQPPGALRLVAVTGYGQESDREKSREAGFDAHLVKPLDLDTILHELEPQGGAGAAARS